MNTDAPTSEPIAVSVVIPYFQDAAMLELVLAGLELDQRSPGPFEVVLADDGSATPPQPGDRPFPVRVVRHDDLGNRTGGARNLGARAARGDLLVFIDGDTVPAPGFIGEIAAVCEGRHLTVGKRRHAELAGRTAAEVTAWLTGDGPAPPILPEPEWLAAGYADSDDLRRSDLRSYRYIISAVLACPRRLFDTVGGFAEELVGYGGEDWEFARRTWLSGAELRHAPRAVGWHDGPDLAGRDWDLRVAKNAETVRIAQLLTDPALRGSGLIWDHPRIIVRLGKVDADGTDGAWVACAESFLRACPDLGFWTNGLALPLSDPRVRRGLPPAQTLGRAEFIIDLTAPVDVTRDELDAWQRDGPVHGGGLLLASSPRDRALGTPPREQVDPTPVPDEVQIESWFGRRARV